MRTSLFTCLVALAAAAPVGQALAADYVGEISVNTAVANRPEASGWTARLNEEVAGLVEAGHMAPLRVQVGETESYFYFTDPFELVLTLSRARPYLNDDLAKKTRTYLRRELADYPPAWVSLLPPDEGRFRENYDLPSDQRTFRWRRWLWRSVNRRPRMMVFYALWAYAEAFDDWDYVEKNYRDLAILYQQELARKPSLVEEAAGLTGFARLARHVGDSQRARQAEATARRIFEKTTDFRKLMKEALDRYDGDARNQGGRPLNRAIIHPLFNLVPETARFLADNHRGAVRRELENLTARYPLWYIPLPPHSEPLFGEGTSLGPDVKAVIFLGKAIVLGASPEELGKDLDIAWLPVGDLYYMQYLTAALLDAAGGTTWKPYRQTEPEKPLYDESAIREMFLYLQSCESIGWKVSKALPDAGGEGLARAYPPEEGAVPGGPGAEEMNWQDIRFRNGSCDLRDLFGADAKGALAYAWMRLKCPEQTRARLYLRNRDGMAAWVNGKEILRDGEGLGWMPGEHMVKVTLRKGWNAVLLKLQQRDGDWRFSARFTASNGAPLEGLTFSTQPGEK